MTRGSVDRESTPPSIAPWPKRLARPRVGRGRASVRAEQVSKLGDGVILDGLSQALNERDERICSAGLVHPYAPLGPEAGLSVGLRVAKRMLTYNTHRGVRTRATNDRKKVAPNRPSSHDAQASHTGRARDL